MLNMLKVPLKKTKSIFFKFKKFRQMCVTVYVVKQSCEVFGENYTKEEK